MIEIPILLAIVNSFLFIAIWAWNEYVKLVEANEEFKAFNMIEDNDQDEINKYESLAIIIPNSLSIVLFINQSVFIQCLPTISSIIFNILLLCKQVNHQRAKCKLLNENGISYLQVNHIIELCQKQISILITRMDILLAIREGKQNFEGNHLFELA